VALESPERNARGPNHLADPPEGWRLLVKSISLPSFPCFVFISDSSILIIDSFARFGPSIRDPSSVASARIPRQETLMDLYSIRPPAIVTPDPICHFRDSPVLPQQIPDLSTW
jgi:hypothetical protein